MGELISISLPLSYTIKMNDAVGAGTIKNPHCLLFPNATHFSSAANYILNKEFNLFLLFLSRDLSE